MGHNEGTVSESERAETVRSASVISFELYTQLALTFDSALKLGLYLTLFEERLPGAETALRCWAEQNQFALNDNSHTIEHCESAPWLRGSVVSTLMFQHDRALIVVHRHTRRQAA